MSTQSAVDPRDPVFVSYRHSDGKAIADELTWLLRAAGIPVWRDVDDLPPGDTEARLQQAIEDGISGAVLVITPHVADSPVVRTVEAPRLLALHHAQPGFALGIVNRVMLPDGGLDYGAPDRLLGLPSAELKGVDQKGASRDGLLEMTRQMLWHRVARVRDEVVAEGRAFRLSIQTRNTPQVYDRTGADLDIRLRPSTHEKLPSGAGLADFAATSQFIPDAVTRSGASGVRVEGGAHLSVALALGAVIPSTRVGAMTVIDGRGAVWASSTEAQRAQPPILQVARQRDQGRSAPAEGRPEVAAYLDLQFPRSDSAFDRFLDAHDHSLSGWVHMVPVHLGLLDSTTAGELAAEAAARLRELSMSNDNAFIHLMVRGPFPMAMLLGRLTNALRFLAYEWDQSDLPDGSYFPPRYEPVLTVRASTPAGAVERVHLPF